MQINYSGLISTLTQVRMVKPPKSIATTSTTRKNITNLNKNECRITTDRILQENMSTVRGGGGSEF